MAPTSNSHLELNVNVGAVLQGSAMIAVMYFDSGMSQSIQLCFSPDELGAVVTTSSASTETMMSQNEDRECVSKDGLVIPYGVYLPRRGMKRSPNALCDHLEEGPSKHRRVQGRRRAHTPLMSFKNGESSVTERRVSGPDEIVIPSH